MWDVDVVARWIQEEVVRRYDGLQISEIKCAFFRNVLRGLTHGVSVSGRGLDGPGEGGLSGSGEAAEDDEERDGSGVDGVEEVVGVEQEAVAQEASRDKETEMLPVLVNFRGCQEAKKLINQKVAPVNHNQIFIKVVNFSTFHFPTSFLSPGHDYSMYRYLSNWPSPALQTSSTTSAGRAGNSPLSTVNVVDIFRRLPYLDIYAKLCAA